MQGNDSSIRKRNLIVAGIVTLVVIVLLVAWQRPDLLGLQPSAEPSTEAPAASPEPIRADADSGTVPEEHRVPELDAATERWTAALGAAPSWPADFSEPASCDEVGKSLDAVCGAIDRQTESRILGASGGACALMQEAAREMARRSPDPSGELHSHVTMLANVFHVFRVLGEERVNLLRHTLDERRDLAEPLALAFYRWLVSRERCAEGGATPIRAGALYDYAGYLFNTMGGQAYLRRRSPRIESLGCFYALQILDRSIARKHNPAGLDPRPEILRCAALIRGQQLVFGDEYLSALESMTRRWEVGP